MQSRLTPAQMHAARDLLNWSVPDLAEAAHVPVSTVERMEGGLRSPPIDLRLAVWDAFAEAGVCFLDDGVGVAWRPEPR